MIYVHLKGENYGDLFTLRDITWLSEVARVNGEFVYGYTTGLPVNYWIGEIVPRYLPQDLILYCKLLKFED